MSFTNRCFKYQCSPCQIDNCFPWLCDDDTVKEKFAKQAEKDFETFLLHRAKELKKGESNIYCASLLL